MHFLFSFKRPGNFILIFFSILFVLPFLAPILSSIGANSISRIIYFIYSWFCHQFHTRSLYLFDHQCAWCARDTGIWAGVLLSSWFYLKGFVGRIRWFHLPIFILPILLDGGTQTISSLININQVVGNSGEYLSNNFLRFVTGAWLGIGIGLWIVPNISEVIGFKKGRRTSEDYQTEMQNSEDYHPRIRSDKMGSENKEILKGYETKNLPMAKHKYAQLQQSDTNIFTVGEGSNVTEDGNVGEDGNPRPTSLINKHFVIIIIFFVLILFYIFLVLLWNLTSQTIKPTNFIDSIPKTQEVTQFERRKYGECPSKGNDIFNLDCFLYGTETKL